MNDSSKHGHAPGPWAVNAVGAVRGAHGCLLAEVLHAASECEGSANAALIGAAPELFNALKRLSFAAPCRLLEAKAELAAANQEACAAIAKAGGA